jgi:hypothetical protein
MTEVKMPEPHLTGGSFLPISKMQGSSDGYTEAQMKQYGDDRAKEALEIAAKLKPLSVTTRNEINLEFTVRQGFGGPDIGYFIDLVIDAVEAAHGITKKQEQIK